MPNGKICYLEIPATDVDTSAAFYTKVFGWSVRARGDGSRAFDDTTGQVSGTWVLGRAPSRDPGIVTYIMVDSIRSTLETIAAVGGGVVKPFTSHGASDAGDALFRDPAGNVLGLYQEPAK